MASIFDFPLIHTIVVEPYLGQSGAGEPLYGPAISVTCFVEERTRRIRTQQTDTSQGDEQLAEATAYAPLETDAPTESRITLPSGRRTFVLQALRRDGGALPVPSHLEIVIA